MPIEEFRAAIDIMAGDVLTALSGLPARLSTNLAERRHYERVIAEVRRELASKALGRAAEMRAAEAQAKGQDDALDA